MATDYDINSKYSDDDLAGGGEQPASAIFVNESFKSVDVNLKNRASKDVVTQTTNGLMHYEDKIKLDNITEYVHPDKHEPSIIEQDEFNRFVTDAEKLEWNEKAVTGSTGTWVPLTLSNSWIAYGSPYELPSYRVNQFNKLKLKGTIKSGTVTSGTTIALLPADCRPEADQSFIVRSYNGSVDVIGSIDIKSTGEIQIMSGSNVFLSLDSIPEIYVQ